MNHNGRTTLTRFLGGWAAKDAVYLDGKGHLVIKTYEKDGKYYGGMIDTKGKFQHKYGYWEARCKLPEEVGHWPAFWIGAPLLQPGIPEIEVDPAKRGTEIIEDAKLPDFFKVDYVRVYELQE